MLFRSAGPRATTGHGAAARARTTTGHGTAACALDRATRASWCAAGAARARASHGRWSPRWRTARALYRVRRTEAAPGGACAASDDRSAAGLQRGCGRRHWRGCGYAGAGSA